jgi:hypothetical protein
MQTAVYFIYDVDSCRRARAMQCREQVQKPAGAVGFVAQFQPNDFARLVFMNCLNGDSIHAIAALALDQEVVVSQSYSYGTIGRIPKGPRNKTITQQCASFRFGDLFFEDLETVDTS